MFRSFESESPMVFSWLPNPPYGRQQAVLGAGGMPTALSSSLFPECSFGADLGAGGGVGEGSASHVFPPLM